MMERNHREILGLKELSCPKCTSQNVMSLRGEINRRKTYRHECKCKNCDCFFLVSSSIMRK